MNRRHQGQSSRQGQQSHSQFRDHDRSERSSRMGQMNQKGNFSGVDTSYGDDMYEAGDMSASQSYRDTDYDLDGSTYGRQASRSQRNLGGRSSQSYSANTYGDYETNDRNRQPSRFSSLDDDRYSADRYSSNRQSSSSERFGYPSNMNSWSGNDRSYNSGRTAGRMGQGEWRSQDSESSFGEGSLGQDWGSQSSERYSSSDSDRHFFGKGPKGYKRSDDRIKEEVCEALTRNPRVDASDIEVSVEDACVTLSGTIDSREAKRAAEMAIENLSGVDDVKNEIKVKRADSSSMMNDSASSSSFASSSGAKSSKTSSTGSKGSSHIS